MNDFDFDISNGAGLSNGGFFKPKEHQSAAVILFEPKGVRRGIQTKFGPKDYVDGDFTIFLTADELKSGSPSTVMEGATCEGNIARSLEGLVGRATVGKLGQKDTGKGNPAWTIDQVDPKLIPQIKEYVQKREQEKQDSVPDFLR